MSTKDKILAEGLRQLNEHGIEKVTIRSIAEKLAISPGNLTYHFKNIDVIIFELYLQLVKGLDASVVALQEQKLSVGLFFELTEMNYRMMWSYRFLLLDFVAITRRITKLRDHFRQLMTLRQMQIRAIVSQMIQQGLLKEEWVEGLYERYILFSLIISDAWASDAEVHFGKNKSQAIPFYADLFACSILPFLTEEGLKDYRSWRKKHPAPSLNRYPNLA